MRRLLSEAMLHIGARLASVVASFLLFSLVARRLPAAEASRVYFFGFAFGFVLATLRMILILASGILGTETASRRRRKVGQGYQQLELALLVSFPFSTFLFWRYSNSLPLAMAAAVVVFFAAHDGDPLRAITRRFSMFSATFAVGSALAFAVYLCLPRPTLATFCLLFVLQWLPVALGNIPVVQRLLRGRGARFPRLGSFGRLYALTGTGLLAMFDGAVLNAPFITLLVLPAETAMKLSIVTRIFVASLPMLPLLMHWSNSDSLTRMARIIRVTAPMGFFLILVTSGTSAGTIFLWLFSLVSKVRPSGDVFVLYLALLGSYAIYVVQMRFIGTRLDPHWRILALGAILVAFMATLRVCAAFFPANTPLLVGIQCLTFLLAASALALALRRQATLLPPDPA